MKTITSVLACGTVTSKFEHPRTWLQRLFACLYPAMVSLTVRDEDGRVSSHKMLAKDCLGAKVGGYARVKSLMQLGPYGGTRLAAFGAPQPKPVIKGRGYLLRFHKGHARIRMDDDSIIEVSAPFKLRGELFEGSAVKFMCHLHGGLEHLRDTWFELDTSRPAWTGLERDAVIHNENFGLGIATIADEEELTFATA
jgi:hypothetical protein